MAKAPAKVDPKSIATYIATTPIKTLNGMVMPGEPIELTARDAAEMAAIGAIEAPAALDA